VISYSKHIHH